MLFSISQPGGKAQVRGTELPEEGLVWGCCRQQSDFEQADAGSVIGDLKCRGHTGDKVLGVRTLKGKSAVEPALLDVFLDEADDGRFWHEDGSTGVAGLPFHPVFLGSVDD